MSFEDFYREADMVIALRGISLEDVKNMTRDQLLTVHETMWDNQSDVIKASGRVIL